MAIAEQLERRRAAVARTWNLNDEVVLIGAGDEIVIPGRGDTTYPFRAHSEYLYLTDRNRPGGVLAFDPQTGWSDFVVPVSDTERLWSGAAEGDVAGTPVSELDAWLHDRRGRRLAMLGVAVALPPASAPTSAPASGRGLGPGDPALAEELRFALAAVRRPKDEVELERMRAAERATSAAFAAAVAELRAGATERSVQIELEAAALRAGGDAMAYDTIVGAGPNSAVLHFMPSDRVLRSGDLVLIDAGAEVGGYASDITRTYPLGGELDAEQGELHGIVRAAELAAIDLCTPGTEWVDVHARAARVIAEGLTAFGLLRGTPDTLVESGAVSLFFPHGVGHLVGLGVRDAGGILAERRHRPPPFPNLRIDLPLQPGFVVTVEPGVYFVPALLRDAERRRQFAAEVAWDRVDRMLGFGGIRIEDNVVIGTGGREVLTQDVPLLG